MGRVQFKTPSGKKRVNKTKSAQKTRKQLRKEKRQQKKISRAVYYEKKRSKSQPEKSIKRSHDSDKIDNIGNKLSRKDKEKQDVKRTLPTKEEKQQKLKDTKMKMEMKVEKKIKKQRTELLKRANLQEDKMIKQLEKKLKLNKRKSKSIPQSFVSEGLDYLLDFCDPDNRSHMVETEKLLVETGSSTEFKEDLDMVIGENEDEHDKKKSKNNKNLQLEKENENTVSDNNSEFDDNDTSELDNLDLDDNYNSELSDDNNSQLSDDNNSELSDDNNSELSDDNNSQLSDDDNSKQSDDDNLESDNNNSDINKKNILSKETNRTSVMSNNHSMSNENKVENEESIQDEAAKQSDNDEELWEDIYGRQRDKKGNIVEKKYVPPAVRFASTDLSVAGEKARKLERQFKGILNRLAEQNMCTIANQVEEMYMSNSRNDMNVMLSKLMMETIVAPVLTPDRLIAEHMMLIAILHANIGTEVGAHFLLTLVKRFHKMLDESHSVENKELDNIIVMISHLYNFKVYGHRLLYQILEKLTTKFTEKEIELTLLILKTVGFSLRKDDPLALKELILNLQQKASDVNRENSRVNFMLDVLMAIKNNNMNKIPQYDPNRIEHLRKLLRNFVRKGNSVTQFNVTLEDLLEADERGKWWIVGSAWSGTKDIDKSKKPLENNQQQYTNEILELARKQRMNTDIRRSIFCVLMTAEDYLDAFEKFHHLGLKGQQQKEIIYVIFNCCLQEKKYNPYYAVLMQKLCDFDRKYQLTMQFALWDKFKTLNDLNTKQLTNLAKFLAHLILAKTLSLSVLKVIQFTELDKPTMRLIRQIILGILLHDNQEVCLEVFGKISLSPKLQTFRDSLRLFISHFLVKNINSTENVEQQNMLLLKRAEIVDKVLSSKESRFIF